VVVKFVIRHNEGVPPWVLGLSVCVAGLWVLWKALGELEIGIEEAR
jgi:hypothetical protein